MLVEQNFGPVVHVRIKCLLSARAREREQERNNETASKKHLLRPIRPVAARIEKQFFSSLASSFF